MTVRSYGAGGGTLDLRVFKMVIVIVLFAGGCSGGAPPGTAGSPVTPPSPAGEGGAGTEAGLEQAARQSFMAFLGGDDQAFFDLLSRECRVSLGFAAVESYLTGRRFRAEDLGGVDLAAVAIADVRVSDFSGSSAEVSLVITGTSEPFREIEPRTWSFEEGGWRLADCADIRESPNELEEPGTNRNEPLGLGDVADIGDWFVSLSHVDLDFEAVVSPGEVEPAADGQQLISAQFLVGYDGPEPSVVIGDHLTFAIAAGSSVYGEEAACRSDLPGLFFDPTMTATPGEDLPRPMVCRSLPTSEVGDDLLARVTNVPSGSEYWFDLSAE